MGEPIAPDALEAARYVVATAEWISGEVDEDPEMGAKIEQGAKVIHALLERAPREPDIYAAPPDVEGLVEAIKAEVFDDDGRDPWLETDEQGFALDYGDKSDEAYHGGMADAEAAISLRLRRALAAYEGGKNDDS